LEPGIFELAFEGFWDLYTFKPKTDGISAKKLQTWINKIRLQTNEMTGVPAVVPQQEEPVEGEEPKEAVEA
jgi:hypothetical protein